MHCAEKFPYVIHTHVDKGDTKVSQEKINDDKLKDSELFSHFFPGLGLALDSEELLGDLKEETPVEKWYEVAGVESVPDGRCEQCGGLGFVLFGFFCLLGVCVIGLINPLINIPLERQLYTLIPGISLFLHTFLALKGPNIRHLNTVPFIY